MFSNQVTIGEFDEWMVFEDDSNRLGAVCDLRPTFELRTGANTTIERLTCELGSVPTNRSIQSDSVLFVNGRVTSLRGVHVDRGEALVDEDGCVLIALLSGAVGTRFIESGFCADALDAVNVRSENDVRVLRYPWQVFDYLKQNLTEDLLSMRGYELMDLNRYPGVAVLGGHQIRTGQRVRIDPNVVLDSSDGVIILDDNVHIRAGAVISGPAFVGEGASVACHAWLRGTNAIGPYCHVGGEVKSCIFQGYSNKTHTGYLGDSFVGEWVNLGSGTTTSNLKNTYGDVRMQIQGNGDRLDTGRQNVGSMLCDHVKTAIGTRLQTGSLVETGAMIALSGFTPKFVERFAFLTDQGTDRYEAEKFIGIAKHVMERRDRPMSAETEHQLRDLLATC